MAEEFGKRRSVGQIIRRGRETWLLRVYAGRGSGRRKWTNKTVHGTRRDAHRILRGMLVARDEGRLALPEKITLGEFLNRWLRDYAASAVAPTTLASYRTIIRLHFTPRLGHIPLQRLSPADIQAYLSEGLHDGKLSTTTLRYHATLLHGALRHAMKWGLLFSNPCDRIDPPRRRRVEMRTWDEEQVRLFLAVAQRCSANSLLYTTAILTAMRSGELAGLRWGDVDFVTGTASVQQTFYRLSGSKKDGQPSQALFKQPKTAKSRRSVALPPVLVEKLRQLREQQEAQRRLFDGDCICAVDPAGCRAYHDYDLIFCQANGKPLRMNNVVRRDFRRTIQRARVPRIRFHDLRHSRATLGLKNGEHPKLVSELLGHSSVAFTMDVYSHVLPGLQAQAAKSFEARLFGREQETQSRTFTE